MQEDEILKKLSSLSIDVINKSLNYVASILHIDKSVLSRLVEKYYRLGWHGYQLFRNDQHLGKKILIDSYADEQINGVILEKINKYKKIYIFGNHDCILLSLLVNDLLFINKQVTIICKEKELVNFQDDGLVFVVKEPRKELISLLPQDYIYVGYKLNNSLEKKSKLKLLIPCYKINQPEQYRYMYYLKKLFKHDNVC